MGEPAPQFESTDPPRLQLVPQPEASLNPDYAPRDHAILIADFFRRTRIRSEDREFEHARMRRETVGYILTQSGVTSENTVESEAFAKNIRELENTDIDFRGGRLGDLADKYEDHPFSQTMDYLHKELGRGQYTNHVIAMRRAGLLLLEQLEVSN